MQTAPRSVLITGANRGLGLEYVRQLVALPTPPKHLFATCRNPDDAQDLQAIASSNSTLKVLKFDVNHLDMLDGLCDAVAKEVEGKGLNLLINNAGINSRATLNSLTEQGMMDTLKTNTVSPLMITKAFLPLLRQAAAKSQIGNLSCHRAMVINTSSLMASISDNGGGFYDYRISKCALNMATSCLAIDLKRDGILAMAIHPGWVQTDMGGASAPVTPYQSISGVLALFDTASEKHAGQLYDFKGKKMDW